MEGTLTEKQNSIVKYLIYQYIFIVFLAFLYLLGSTFIKNDILDLDLKLPIVGSLLILMVGVLLFSSRYRKNRLIWWALVSVQVMFSFTLLAFYGTTEALPYLALTTVIYSTSVIYGWKAARNITMIIVILVLILIVLHYLGFNPIETDQIDSHPINTLVLCFFLWVNVNIARIGYQQIEHSYNSAVEYSNKLELVNRELDKMVEERTEKLEESWIDRVKNLEKIATVGHISSTLLHDLKTPLSSMAISLEMIRGNSHENTESIDSLEQSYEQIVKLIEGADSLMNNHEVREYFSVEKQMKSAVKLVKTLSKRENVTISITTERDVEIYGQQTMFLRVVLNLLVNSIEELSQKRKGSRMISLSSENAVDKVKIVVRDNGDGIPEEELTEVFDPGFGKKHGSKNYGLGLNFVKETVENEFRGSVDIVSEVGEFTEVILMIPTSGD